ncbi:MAG: pyruvate, phosphate dikinase [Planctomycetes bacterium]|nr:pyruvate, phosphate dikinase [Planctomycetota bacterium]
MASKTHAGSNDTGPQIPELQTEEKSGSMSKYVYSFGGGKADGRADMKSLLGGKGANLAEMANLGIPVPPGLTITTEVCALYSAKGSKYPDDLEKQVDRALRAMEKHTGRKFGNAKNPLLVSVRSGAPVSMPGMMDTVLNLGLNDETVQGLAGSSNNERFAWDSYRRFVQMYGDVVLGMKPEGKHEEDPFEVLIEAMKKKKRVKLDTELSVDALKELVSQFKAAIKKKTKKAFPTDPKIQLWGAISAVFGSWHNDRAISYRRLEGIAEDLGTAVNVQAMVYGNTGDDSATGVAFTRDAATGEKRFYGEYLINAQGEDVVAGTRTPEPIEKLEKVMPKAYRELTTIYKKLEKHYRDMQDIEFTIEDGRLWLLQTRSGKRTGFASVKIAVDMAKERLITRDEALMRVKPFALEQIMRPIFDPKEYAAAAKTGRRLAKGLNAGPGAATGRVVFHADDAVAWKKKGEQVILVRIETSPEDIEGMDAAVGILTARGGMTSHAAVVARQMGKTCVAGCGALHIDYKKRKMVVNGKTVKEGDWISLNGSNGEVFEGTVATSPSEINRVLVDKNLKPEKSEIYLAYAELMKWADKARRMRIRTNADQPDQSQVAIAFGAEGIGLCRTEHMFFGEEKILHMRAMILADSTEERRAALKKLLPYQRKDFEGIFKAMDGYPVTIRALDPPLHEFLPHEEREQRSVAKEMGVTPAKLREKIADLHEFNPMLGHRGCRLGITYPEITEMQARAIFEAAVNVKAKGIKVKPEVMIPLVGHVKELELQARIVHETAAQVFKEKKTKLPYMVGTMIEIPRAALTADEIAIPAEFFSFGTNDLTQTAFGLSRDDSSRFLAPYQELGIYETDPFASLDTKGVGQLMKIAVEKGRHTRPEIKLGICGEHGGDPSSIRFCDEIGLDYVSCSPYRVPIARLVAAQATISARS